MYKFKLLVLPLVLVCAMTMLGCPAKEVIVMDDHPEFSLKAIGQDVVDFFTSLSGKTPIEVGDIIVGTAGGGFLRRVLNVDERGSAIATETEFCSLAEAIKSGTLKGAVSFTPEDFAKADVPMAKTGDITIDLSGTTIFSKDGVTLSVSHGTISYAPDITLNAEFANHKLKSFEAKTVGTLAVDMNFKVAATKDATLNWETPVFPAITKPFVFYIGPVPVAGTASLSMPFGVAGTISAGASAESGFDGTTQVSLGAKFVNGAWTDESDFGDFSPNAHPIVIKLSSAAGLDIYMKLNAGLNLYGCSDLTGYVQPYVAADAQFVPSPFTFVLTAGINGGIGYELGIFDINLIDKDWFFPGPQWELYRYSVPYTVPTTFTFSLPL